MFIQARLDNDSKLELALYSLQFCETDFRRLITSDITTTSWDVKESEILVYSENELNSVIHTLGTEYVYKIEEVAWSDHEKGMAGKKYENFSDAILEFFSLDYPDYPLTFEELTVTMNAPPNYSGKTEFVLKKSNGETLEYKVLYPFDGEITYKIVVATEDHYTLYVQNSVINREVSLFVQEDVVHYKTVKKKALSTCCEQKILAGFVSNAAGGEAYYSFDLEAQLNLTAQLALFNNTDASEVFWKTEDKGIVELTKDQFIILYQDGMKHKTDALEKYWLLIEELAKEEVDTQSKVDALQW